jgi:alpha-tubulin suppressor-like RCC1 family protein
MTQTAPSAKDVERQLLEIPVQNIILSCGQNDNGQLGVGFEHRSTDYQPLHVIQPKYFSNQVVTHVSCGRIHTLYLCANSAYANGRNSSGQLGIKRDSFVPAKITALSDVVVVNISAGGNHSLFLDNNGIVWSCGQESAGELGRPVNGDSNIPVAIKFSIFNERICKIQGGDSHSVFITGKI